MGKDSVTGLNDKVGFYNYFNDIIADAVDNDKNFSCVVIDVDFFGKINDQFGRDAGDRLLLLIANFFNDNLKGIDIYRIGGDEFSAIIKDQDKEDVFLIFEDLRKRFEPVKNNFIEKEKMNLELSLSMGISQFPYDGTSEQEIMRKAKDALFRSKQKGKNRISLAREEKMVTKTTHYTPGQLERLTRLSKKIKIGEAVLLREALDDILSKYNLN